MLFQLIAEYVIVKGSKAPCHPALRVGQCVNDCPSAAHVTLAVWPELSKPFCERRTPCISIRTRKPSRSHVRRRRWSSSTAPAVHLQRQGDGSVADTLLGRSLCKPCVRIVRLPHPVPHRYPKRVDALIHQGAKVSLGHPLLPMLTQLPVALTRAQNAAKSVVVHCRLLRWLPLKLIEQTGRHPGLQH